MRNTPNQGLAGKARRKRVRTRTTRLYQQQLIEDYLHSKDDADEVAIDRSIPIGHRREFVPTVEPDPDDSAAGQLELCLTPIDDDREEAFVAVGKSTTPRITRESSPRRATRTVAEPVVGVRANANSGGELKVPVHAFTWRGFAFGCAIGGAAAAVLMVFVRIAFA